MLCETRHQPARAIFNSNARPGITSRLIAELIVRAEGTSFEEYQTAVKEIVIENCATTMLGTLISILGVQ